MIQREFIRLGERVININLIRHIEFQKETLSIKIFLSEEEELVFKFSKEPDYSRCETYISMYTTKFDGAEEIKSFEKRKILN